MRIKSGILTAIVLLAFLAAPLAAADVKAKYGAPATLTCSLAPGGTGLANDAARSSTAVDNSATLYLDALVQVQIKSGGATAATGYVNVYAYGSADGGTSYAEGAGTDAAITLTNPTNAKIIGRLNVVANTTTYISEPMSVAAAFGGVLPAYWGIIIENKTGGALDTTEANHKKLWQGVLAQSP